MFTEPPAFKGWIEVICGSMFSGKTEELLRRIKRARIAEQQVRIFKPLLDNRYDRVKVVSHDSNFTDSFPVKLSSEILEWSKDVEVIAIDEAQFFDQDLPKVCNELASQGKRVIAAGLDMDFSGKPFGPIPDLMAIAEYVTKVHAICVQCGNQALYSFRFHPSAQQIELGEKDKYEPRCRKCFNEGKTAESEAKP